MSVEATTQAAEKIESKTDVEKNESKTDVEKSDETMKEKKTASKKVSTTKSSPTSKSPPTNYTLQSWLLFLLVFQNCSVILATRYSRVVTEDLYFTTTAVLLSEMLKVVICSSVMFYQSGVTAGLEIVEIFTVKLAETLKMAVPAILYVFQNNLLYVAASNLDAAVFQVLSQLKLLTTALFAVIILRKELNWFKWVSLLILFAGISLVQFDNFRQADQHQGVDKATHNAGLGLLAVVGAAVISGFVGVYVEKQLKDVTASLWVKNIQLSVFGTAVAGGYVVVKDGYSILDKGFFFGYTPLVCSVIIMQAGGGILVAAVIKYADNIIKGFATSIALVVSFIASIFIFGFLPNIFFVTGLTLVGISTYMYSRPN